MLWRVLGVAAELSQIGGVATGGLDLFGDVVTGLSQIRGVATEDELGRGVAARALVRTGRGLEGRVRPRGRGGARARSGERSA